MRTQDLKIDKIALKDLQHLKYPHGSTRETGLAEMQGQLQSNATKSQPDSSKASF